MNTLASESTGKIAAALIDAQAAFKPAVKDATNPHFQSKFVSLNGVLDAVSQALRAAGIALVQQTDVTDNGTTVLVTRLVHGESGEWLAGVYPIRPVKADPQSEGSALTYARRYALMSLVGIAPEDDDGHAASAKPQRDPALDGLRGDIWKAANESGLMTWTDIGSDYLSWSMGDVIGDATLDDLTRYRDHLRSAVPA